VAILKIKTYIALVLTFIFLAKFLAIDANGLNVLFNGSEISFVNLHCKKENSPKQTKKTVGISQADQPASQVIDLVGFCTSQFQFELFTWETDYPKRITVFNNHITSRLTYLYLENASPPPRLA